MFIIACYPVDTTGAKLSNDSQKIRLALYKSRLWRSPCDNLKGICYNENNDTKEEGLCHGSTKNT